MSSGQDEEEEIKMKIVKMKQELNKKLIEKDINTSENVNKTMKKDLRAKNQGQQCQKCLQIGHWSYQCKNQAVYAPRPSKTSILKGENSEIILESEKMDQEKLKNLDPLKISQERKRLEEELEKLKKRKREDFDSSSDSNSSNSSDEE